MRHLLAVLVVAFAACAPRPRVASAPADAKTVRLEVPFFANETNLCGPAALASVLNFWGKDTDPDKLREEIYRARLQGSLTIDLLLAAQSRGMVVEMLDADLDGIRRQLDEGKPLIAFIDVGNWFYPVGHYVVLTGYDEARQGFYLHSGLKKDQFQTYRQFVSRWEKTGQWTLLVTPVPTLAEAESSSSR